MSIKEYSFTFAKNLAIHYCPGCMSETRLHKLKLTMLVITVFILRYLIEDMEYVSLAIIAACMLTGLISTLTLIFLMNIAERIHRNLSPKKSQVFAEKKQRLALIPQNTLTPCIRKIK
ncbi:MAG: hypothetical protein HRU20_13625 [Pseudomonadales bacterium]|nr:hypothetical protein [Pseudomonadales bacterium]